MRVAWSRLLPPTGRPTTSASRGRTDGRAGLSRRPSRHYGSFPASQTASFNRGYEVGYNQGIRPGSGSGSPSYGQPLTAVQGSGMVMIREGRRTKAICRTAKPNIERTRFINEQQQIVIKSRGSHGPATVQLFDTRTGAEQGRVLAYEIQRGRPRWAAGMGD